MSQYADHCSTFKSKLIKHKENYKVVIDVFIDMITNQDWCDESIIEMLSYGLGVSPEIDIEINKEIKKQKLFLDLQ